MKKIILVMFLCLLSFPVLAKYTFVDISKACNMGFYDEVTDDKKGGWTVFIKFNLGRLIAYIIVGAVFGYLGAATHSNFLNTFSRWILIILAGLLIFYGLGLSLPKISWCAWTKKIKMPFSQTDVRFLMQLHYSLKQDYL